MGWSRIDNGIKRNPKLLKVSSSAKLFYVWGILYCNEMSTDGFIDDSIIPILAVETGDINYESYLKELTTVQPGQRFSLLERVDNGYLVHNYLDYNLSHEQVEERVRVHAETSKKGGRASAMVRWGKETNNRIVTEGVTGRLPEMSPDGNRMVTDSVTEMSPDDNHINSNININKNRNRNVNQVNGFPAENPDTEKQETNPVEEKTVKPKKVAKEGNERDTRIDHPAIQAWRAATGRYPKKTLWDFIIKNMGEQVETEKLAETITQWCARGWNPGNISGIINVYKNGFEERKNGNGSKPKGYHETCPPGDSDPDVVYKTSIKGAL